MRLPPSLPTDRLFLLPYTPQFLLALIDSAGEFERLSGWNAAPGLRNFLVSDEVSPAWVDMLHASSTADPWTLGFAVTHRENNLVIGNAAFKGPPNEDGIVEIAYGIVPDYESQGYATEAAQALVAFASNDPRTKVIQAHTAPASNASTRVLTKCGFEYVGAVDDPEDGLVWRWVHGTNVV